jgi:hypothetical protein
MTAVLLGVPALLIFMTLVMGGPIYYYTKRDIEFQKFSSLPDNARAEKWYER